MSAASIIALKRNNTYAIQGIKESVEEISRSNFLWFIDLVVYLIERHGLWVYQ